MAKKVKQKKSKIKKKHSTTSLPTALRKELASVTKRNEESDTSENNNEENLLVGNQYEYEEDLPEEESQKNRRYDAVDKLEYELPSDFEDEEIDEGAASGEDSDGPGRRELLQTEKKEGQGSSDSEFKEVEEYLEDSDDQSQDEMEQSERTEEEEDEVRHQKMLHDVTGMSSDDLEGLNKKTKRNVVVSEACPESEYNLDNKSKGAAEVVSIQDLMDPLYGSTGFGSLRKKVHNLQKASMLVQAPLPKVVQDKMERKVAYLKSKQEISKWQPIVKKNRESSTIRFDNKVDMRKHGIGTITSEFMPVTELEKEVSTLLRDKGVVDAQNNDGAEILELNQVTVDEVKERQNRLAKMRSLLFRHELKAKHLKKIKSKTYHRLLKKERSKAGLGDIPTNPEAAKEYALKQEFKRAEERMTLKHKNTSKWVKRALKRGIQKQDEGTRAAIAEQLSLNNMLTRKIHSLNESSESDESSSEDDEGEDENVQHTSTDGYCKSRIIEKAKEKTLEFLGTGDEEEPKSGILSLPFMVRGLEKKKKQVNDEAAAVLQELDSKLQNDDDIAASGDEAENHVKGRGRIAFNDLNKKKSSIEIVKDSNTDFDMPIDKGDGTDDDVESDTIHYSSEKNAMSDNCREFATANINIDDLHEDESFNRQCVETVGHVVVDIPNKAKDNHTDSCKGFLSSSSKKTVLHEPAQISGICEINKNDPSNLVEGNPWLFGVGEHVSHETISNDRVTAHTEKRKKKRKRKGGKKDNTPDAQEPNTMSGTKASVAGVPKKNNCSSENRDIASNARLLPCATSDQQETLDTLQLSEDVESEEEDALEGAQQYHTLSQTELIERAFAGDDVQMEFERAKEETVNEELPPTEAVVSLPGWGEWTHVQQKMGLPKWILKKQEEEKRKKEEALKKRKDAKLKYVVISEKRDIKSEKYKTSSVPFPYDSRETFERNMRMPLGSEFNTAHAHLNMIQPPVVKKPGVIIDPIKFDKKQIESETLQESGGKRKQTDQKKLKNNFKKQRPSKTATAPVR
eukprot:TRINITY_DN2378_c0_g1_i2.p1 TRINITY_DN2378_c0_g1~~TRINITY_DN2378_c0_g1_i2.p1  ORF type:complete len:1024 (+),score=313.79 TRINITY_DN2378_c0_g1_i2:359-3430(+)